jgi:hypothetical protein
VCVLNHIVKLLNFLNVLSMKSAMESCNLTTNFYSTDLHWSLPLLTTRKSRLLLCVITDSFRKAHPNAIYNFSLAAILIFNYEGLTQLQMILCCSQIITDHTALIDLSVLWTSLDAHRAIHRYNELVWLCWFCNIPIFSCINIVLSY